MSASLHRRVSAIVSRGVGSSLSSSSEDRVRAIQGLDQLQQAAQEAREDAREEDGTDAGVVASSSSSAAGGGSASLQLHRSFRLLLQSRSVDLHRSLLREFASVASELRSLESHLDESAQLAQQLASELREMKVRSNDLFQSSAALTARQRDTDARRELVQTFLTQFQLDPIDARALNETTAESIDEAFFGAIRKIAEIKRNIEAMLSGHAAAAAAAAAATRTTTPHQLAPTPSGSHSEWNGSMTPHASPISLDLLDTLSKQLEVAYEKLYRSIQGQLSSQRVVKTSDLDTRFVTSFRLLREIPVFFTHCLGDLVSARRSLLIERFLKALSRGSAGARPIELAANDPVRYCSDMLAWVHQALANEKEFLSTLFPPEEVLNGDGPNAVDATIISAAGPRVHDYQIYLASIFEALSRPLRVRIEQSFNNASGLSGGTAAAPVATAATHAQIETVFKIWNILKFYRVIIEPILPQTQTQTKSPTSIHDAASLATIAASVASTPAATDLLSTLALLSGHARSSFFRLLGVAGERLARSATTPPPSDLSPSPLLVEWLAQLSAIMNIYNSSLIAPAEKEDEFEEIMTQMVEPMLGVVGLGHSTSIAVPPVASSPDAVVDQLLYRINVLQSILTVCFTFPSFVSRRIETLNFLVSQQVELLVDQQARQVWRKAGLEQIIQAAVIGESGGANIATLQAIGAAGIGPGVHAFYASLLSVGAFIVPQCDRLLHTPIRRHCRIAIAKLISAQYRQLYAAVTLPANGFNQDQIQAIFLQSPAHVDLLLDLTGSAAAAANNAKSP